MVIDFSEIKVGEFFSDPDGFFVRVEDIYDPRVPSEPTNAILLVSNNPDLHHNGTPWYYRGDEEVSFEFELPKIVPKKPATDLGDLRNLLASLNIRSFTRYDDDNYEYVWIIRGDGLFNVCSFDSSGKRFETKYGVEDK